MLPGIKEHFEPKPRWLFGSFEAKVEIAQEKAALYVFFAIMLVVSIAKFAV